MTYSNVLFQLYYKVIFSNKMRGGVNLKTWNHYSWTFFLLKTSVSQIIFPLFYNCVIS